MPALFRKNPGRNPLSRLAIIGICFLTTFLGACSLLPIRPGGNDTDVSEGGQISADALATTRATWATATQVWLDQDEDRDGLSNSQEDQLGTNKNRPDSDGDGLNDGDEVNTHKTDPKAPDSDGDGVNDGNEIRQELEPHNPDTDGDGIPDGEDGSPLQTSPPTITPTPTSTFTPTPTPTDTATPTPTPTFTTTPRPTNTPTATPTPTPTFTPTPAIIGKLAFELQQNISFKSYVIRVSTGPPAGFLNDIPDAAAPSLSRDGQALLVDSTGGGIDVIARLPVANARKTIVTCPNFTADSSRPVWSPDGRFIAFDGLGVDPANPQIYIQDLNADPDCDLVDNRLAVQGGLASDAHGLFPLWGLDGRIYFRSCSYWDPNNRGLCGIWSVKPDGRDPIQVTTDGNHIPTDVHGNRVLFMYGPSGQWDVYAVNTSGGAPVNLTHSRSSIDVAGTFAPDGRTIAFLSNRSGRWAIWLMNADGSNPRLWLAINPDWGDVVLYDKARMSWSP